MVALTHLCIFDEVVVATLSFIILKSTIQF